MMHITKPHTTNGWLQGKNSLNDGNIQRRYIRRPTCHGRFLRHMVPAMQDDAPHLGAGEGSAG